MKFFRFSFIVLLLLPVMVMGAGDAFAVTESGYLAGPGSSYSFTVNAGSVDYVEVLFSYPVGSVDFWVEVVGEDGFTVLGDFDLDSGEVIILQNGGTFYLTIYSDSGGGSWSATYNLGGGSTTTGSAVTESGYLAGPGSSYSFTVNAGTVDYVEVTFSYPMGSVDFWVEVLEPESGTVLGDFDLYNDGEIIQLMGGGTFYLTIYSNSGGGNWSATYDLGGGGTTTGADCNVSTNEAWGYLTGTNDYCSWAIDCGSVTYLEVPFSYPMGSVDFWVEVIGQDGITLIGDLDLDTGEIIILQGGGTFYLTIYSRSGSGNWSCNW